MVARFTALQFFARANLVVQALPISDSTRKLNLEAGTRMWYRIGFIERELGIYPGFHTIV